MKLKELPVSWWHARQLMKKSITASETQEVVPVIVSLTSIPSRLDIVHLTIRSLFAQAVRPKKIFLWLHESLSKEIPKSLQALTSDLFEIRYVDLTCPHRKLIHAIGQFPDEIIVTCDDDLMYNPAWLERLYESHRSHPQDIIAHECRLIKFMGQGKPAPYNEWKTESRTAVSETWLMPIGYGGVLYPPGCLYKDVGDVDLFLRLAPRADDLWFKAMSYLAGTQTRRSADPVKKPIPIIASQKNSLKRSNVRQDGNYQQWLALCEHYKF